MKALQVMLYSEQTLTFRFPIILQVYKKGYSQIQTPAQHHSALSLSLYCILSSLYPVIKVRIGVMQSALLVVQSCNSATSMKKLVAMLAVFNKSGESVIASVVSACVHRSHPAVVQRGYNDKKKICTGQGTFKNRIISVASPVGCVQAGIKETKIQPFVNYRVQSHSLEANNFSDVIPNSIILVNIKAQISYSCTPDSLFYSDYQCTISLLND